jgi:uncharacterized membrane protein YhaH (DUF805 family)
MSVGVWQLLLLLFLVALFVWPVVRILHKAGRSGWWVLTMLVPGLNLFAVWIFAYAPWPAVDPEAGPPPGS